MSAVSQTFIAAVKIKSELEIKKTSLAALTVPSQARAHSCKGLEVQSGATICSQNACSHGTFP